MARTPKSTDTAAQVRKTDADNQKVQDGSLAVGNQPERTPTATELARDMPEVFGAEKGSENALDDKLTPLDRQIDTGLLTTDEKAAAGIAGIEGNPPTKDKDGNDIPIHTRVMVHTPNPIGGQLVNPGYVIGYGPNGINVRLELTDGSQARPLEFGGLKQDAGEHLADVYFTMPDDGTDASK